MDAIGMDRAMKPRIVIEAWPLGETDEWMASVKLDWHSWSASTLRVAQPTGPLAKHALAQFLRDLAEMGEEANPFEATEGTP
jgi:hypothetical protein